MKKPLIIKILLTFLFIYIFINIVSLLIIFTTSFNGPELATPFFQGFYQGIVGNLKPLSTQQMGYYVGTITISLIPITLCIFAIFKKSNNLKRWSLAIFILLFLGNLGKGSFSFGILMFIILLNIGAVKKYFPIEKD